MVGGPGDLRSVVNSNMSTFVRVTGVVLCTSLVSLALAVGVDQHLHRKFDSVGALNYRGYRGDVVGEKQQGERRVGVFGGSVAMGYGVAPDRQEYRGTPPVAAESIERFSIHSGQSGCYW